MIISSNFNDLIDEIQKEGKELGFTFNIQEDEERTHIKLSPKFNHDISVCCEVSKKDGFATPYVSIRTSSWTYNGERTDLHDVFSQILAALYRTSKQNSLSFTIWDDPNAWSEIKVELYARILVVEQPFSVSAPFDGYMTSIIKTLMYGVLFFQHLMSLSLVGLTCRKHMPSESYSWEKCKGWAKKIAGITGENLNTGEITYNLRKSPDWKYYRSYDLGLGIISNSEFSRNLFNSFSQFLKDSIRIVDSVNGQIYHSELANSINNFVSNELCIEIETLLNSLDKRIKRNFFLIPNENSIVAFSPFYTLFLARDTSKKAFEIEREHLKKRHQLESRLIFPINTIQWLEKIDDNQFELLIRELLSREENVSWVRKVGNSRERDGGRDLIADWLTSPLNDEEAKQMGALMIERKVLVQCKASSKGLGKSDVVDIRDTIEHFDADGYFLAVSSYLKGTLTDHLSKMRNKKEYFIDWWTRDEIEDKLVRHPDLIQKYNGIFKVD